MAHLGNSLTTGQRGTLPPPGAARAPARSQAGRDKLPESDLGGKNRELLFSRRPQADSSTLPLVRNFYCGKGAADKPCGKNLPKGWNRTVQRLNTNPALPGIPSL